MRNSLFKNRGFSLVELMVGITIGMIALLIMSQVLGTQSSQKQTTASGANAQASGAIALFTIERDARMAGFGLNGVPLLGCNVSGTRQMEVGESSFNFSFVPVRIASDDTSYTLTITYGASDGNLSPPKLRAAHSGDTSDYQVENRFGFHLGDVIIVGQDGKDENGDGINDCVMAQVTGLPSQEGQTSRLSIKGITYTNPKTNKPVSADYNSSEGPGIGYAVGARVYNTGIPVSRSYTLDKTSGRLTVQNLLGGAQEELVADNIVALRAEYGKDSNEDGTVDVYDTTAPANAAEWKRVLSLRVAVVARSDKREPGVVSAATIKLWPDVTLPSGDTEDGPTMALTEDQRHYRYRVFQTLVPLRNQIWTIPANG